MNAKTLYETYRDEMAAQGLFACDWQDCSKADKEVWSNIAIRINMFFEED